MGPTAMPRVFRLAILLLAIVATLGVATASASPAHIHAKTPAAGCEICFTAHIVSYESAFAIEIPTAPQAERAVPAFGEPLTGYQPLFVQTSLTRGPPQL